MAHDVFVCYSSEDKTIANAACAKLESAGIRCWMAPRDAIAGIPYGRQLVDAIGAARIVLLIFSGNANQSEHVLRELEVASDSGKIIVPFRIENVVPSGDLRYYITRVHWLDAMSPPMEARLNELVTLMQRLLDLPIAAPATAAPAVPHRPKFSPVMGGAIILMVAALASAFGLYVSRQRSAAPHVAVKPTAQPKRAAKKVTATHAAISAPQPTPRLVYVAAPPPQAGVVPAAAPTAAPARAKPLPRATVARKRSAQTPSPAPLAAPAQSAPVPWHGATAYAPNWQVGGCTITSQTLNFFTIPAGPYAGMVRLISHQVMTGTGCALRFSYALYSANNTYLGTLTESYNSIGLERRAQTGAGASNFRFNSARFGSAAYIVRRAVPQ